MADFSAADVAALRKATGAGMMDCKKALAGERRRHRGGQGLAAHEGHGRREQARRPLGRPGCRRRPRRRRRRRDRRAHRRDRLRGQGRRLHGRRRRARPARGAGGQGTSSPSIAYEGGTVGEHITQLAAQARRERRARPGRGLRVHRRSPRRVPAQPERAGRHRRAASSSAGSTRATPRRRRSRTTSRSTSPSAAPQYVTRDDVPADVIEQERAVFEELTRNEGKPENAIPKIVEGRLNGFYKDNVLLEQGVRQGAEDHHQPAGRGSRVGCHRAPLRARQDRRGLDQSARPDSGPGTPMSDERSTRPSDGQEPVRPSGAQALG